MNTKTFLMPPVQTFNFDLKHMQKRLKGKFVEVPRFQTNDFSEWSKHFDK